MTIRWRSAFRYPQTILLLIGTALGYGALIVFSRLRWIGVVAGAAIALVMVATWFLQFRRDRAAPAGNPLEAPVMREHLDAIAARYPAVTGSPDWKRAYEQAIASQAAAAKIAECDALLVPDLIETLYTVEGLVQQVAGSYAALEQVQTAEYQQLTRQQLTASRDRLRETHDQLLQLRDQLVVAQLTTAAATDTTLPARLQLLIDANKTALHPTSHDTP